MSDEGGDPIERLLGTDLIAVRLEPGLALAAGRVPAGCIGARRSGATAVEVLAEGEAFGRREDAELWLLRRAPWRLLFRLPAAGNCGDRDRELEVAIDLVVRPRASSVRLLLGALEPGAVQVTGSELAAELEPRVRGALEEATRRSPGEGFGLEGLDAQARSLVARAVELGCFERGVDLAGEIRSRPCPVTSSEARIGSAGAAGRWSGRGEPAVLLLAGCRLLAVRPWRAERPIEEWLHLDGSDLGPLRSLGEGHWPGEAPSSLVGARRGVWVVPERGGEKALGYELPRPPRGNGGVSSAVIHGDTLLAAHSGLGLVSWRRGAPRGGRVLRLPPAGGLGLRGLQRGDRGLLWYVSGAEVRAFDLASSREDRWVLEGAGEEISALSVLGRSVAAGTRDGRLLCWPEGRGSPRLLARLGTHPVRSLRPVPGGGPARWAAGARAPGVTLHDAAGRQESIYRAPRPVRIVDAAGDLLCASDASGRLLFVWSLDRASEPRWVVPLGEKIRDLKLATGLRSPV